MCNYFKKLHPCNCLSRIQIDRCVSACQTNTVCVVNFPDDATFRETARRSYIDCFDCIMKEVKAERENMVVAAATAAVAVHTDDIARLRELKTLKLEQNRRIAEEKMRAEREEDRKREEQLRREKEEEKTEGGLWVDVGSARKKKVGKGIYGPRSAFPRMGGGAANGAMGSRLGIPSFAPLNTPSGAASAPPSAYFGGSRMGGFRKESEFFKKDIKTGKSHETIKKSNELTKKENEPTMKENQPTKTDKDTTKKEDESGKKDDEVIRNGNKTTKKGIEATKKDDETTKNGNETNTKGSQTNRKENQPTIPAPEPTNANANAADRGRAGVWGRKIHGHGNTVPKKILTKSDNMGQP